MLICISQVIRRSVPPAINNSNRIKISRKCFSSRSSSHDGTIGGDKPSYSVSEVTIPVPGGVIAGKLWEPQKRNESIPPVICVHGWLDNANSFDTLIPRILPSVPTPFFCMDSPGHGLTTYCSQWFYDGWVDGMVAVQRSIRHLGWDNKKYTWLGHSMGAISGFIASSLFPKQIHKYIALDILAPPAYNYLDTLRSSIDLVFEVEEREKIPRKAYPFETLVERFYEGRMGTVSKEGCRILLQRGSELAGENLYRLNYNFRTLIPGQEGRIQPDIVEDIASRIKCPMCYIKADPGNKYWEEDDLNKIIQIIRDSNGNRVETHLVPGTHHFHLDSPELLAPIISSFLLSS